MPPLVSVIIPIYNVAQYLEECLNSVAKQTYCNLDVILIDDGSTDACPLICDKWAEKDSRFRVVHKKNAGLGMARNTGIENAAGKYICFFDSDDFIALNTIEHAVILAEQENADVVVFGLSSTDEQGNITGKRTPCSAKDVYTGTEVQSVFLADMIGANPQTGIDAYFVASACTGLYSMELIRRVNWKFVSERDVISEDIYSLLTLFRFVNKVAVLKEAPYFYRLNTTSLSHSYRKDRYEKVKTFYIKCLELCDVYGYSEDVKRRCMAPFLGNTIAALKQEIAAHQDALKSVNALKSIIDDSMLQRVLLDKKKDKTSLKIRLLFWTIRCRHYVFCYILLWMQIKLADFKCLKFRNKL